MPTDFRKADKLVDAAMKSGLTLLGNDVRKRAIVLAPKDSGDLRRSAKVDIQTVGDGVEISFNTAYAKRRHYENYLHPSTKLYLNNALKSITNIGNYFKESF